jgi:hypothetical protein
MLMKFSLERKNCSPRMQTPETCRIKILPGIRFVGRDSAVLRPPRTETDFPSKVAQIPRIITSLLRISQLGEIDLQLLRSSGFQRKSFLQFFGQECRSLQKSKASPVQFSKTCPGNDDTVCLHTTSPFKIGRVFQPLLRPGVNFNNILHTQLFPSYSLAL